MATTIDRLGYEIWVSKIPGRKKIALLCVKKGEFPQIVGYFNSDEAAEVFVNTITALLKGIAVEIDGSGQPEVTVEAQEA